MSLLSIQLLVWAGIAAAYPGVPGQRFYYQVPGGAPLLAYPRPQYLPHADPYSQLLYHNPLPASLLQREEPQDKEQLVYLNQAGQVVNKDGQTEEGASSGGYIDSFVSLVGSYWPGQTAPPTDNNVQPPAPQAPEGNAAAVEEKPQKQVEPAKKPAVPAPAAPVPDNRKSFVMVPAVRAPQQLAPKPAYQAPPSPVIPHEMFDSFDASLVRPGSGALAFHKMVAAARLKASQAGLKAALAEQDAHSVMAEEDKAEEGASAEEGSDPSVEQESYGPSIAQAKPQAVSVAGLGGVAAAAPVGTAVVGPGGMALSAPHATAVAGAGRKPSLSEEKLRAAARHPTSHIPPASYFLRY